MFSLTVMKFWRRFALGALCLSSMTLLFAADYTQDIHPLMEKYCLSCHGEKRPKGGINLAKNADFSAWQKNPRTVESVSQQLRDQVMPPDGKPQPTPEEREKLFEFFQQTIASLDFETVGRHPGRVLIRRLSRTEYNHTIRDLLGIDTKPADTFPSDGGGGGGFDNNAQTLYLPPILLERYLQTAHELVAKTDSNRLFPHQPGFLVTEKSAARKNLESFASRAFRRPLETTELNLYLHHYEKLKKEGKPHEEALRASFTSVLVSPNFLFRIEKDQPVQGAYRINDFELATRLSYFLWSSMPDSILLDLASRKKLRDPKILDQQIQRMLADPKATALAENFAFQWLGLRKLETSVQPDRWRFPFYNASLRQAMTEEPLEFFTYLLKENKSILELLDSSVTYVNEDLAKLYGIEGVTGREMRRVDLKDSPRGGVLTMAGILTMTSYPLRSSPVLRGKWILEEILGTPPPPPPPLIKSLPPDDGPREGLTFRQQLEVHRKKSECAACHRKMDPLGFALENFDAVGRWRTKVGDTPVDASGELSATEKFAGAQELKKLLVQKKSDLFVKNFTEKLLAYALGRGIEYYDIPSVTLILKESKQSHYSLASLVKGVVHSLPFQYRINQSLETTPGAASSSLKENE